MAEISFGSSNASKLSSLNPLTVDIFIKEPIDENVCQQTLMFGASLHRKSKVFK